MNPQERPHRLRIGPAPGSQVLGRIALVLALFPALNGTSSAAHASNNNEVDDLTQLSIEELMALDVTVVSRSKRKFSDLPAAVYVITGDEIRRSGHSSIPEVLRMVPGIYVSRWTTAAWDVTARGYDTGLALTNLAYSNQLLVMLDGVVVYTPLFPALWWPLQDLDLRDVERIEVVRGPAGVLWGSNAVHGIVNIITRDASKTQGFRSTFRNGRDDRHASVRYGVPLGDSGHLRVWGKWTEYDTLQNPFLDFDSRWDLGSAGFRADWVGETGKHYTFWARGYDGHFEEIAFDLNTFTPFLGRGTKDGQMALASIEDPDSGSRWQAWYSLDNQEIPTLANIRILTVDVEYSRQMELTENNSLTLGAGYRWIESALKGDDPFYLDWDPRHVTQNNWRVFAVDNFRIPDANLEFDLGMQIEHNEFSGMESQPTLRASWGPREDLTVWAGFTRAVRTPSLEERTLSDGSFFVGNDRFRSEEVLSTELGVRKRLSENAVVDLSLFHNDYDHLRSNRDLGNGQFEIQNQAKGITYGAELAIDLTPTDRWRLRSAYSYLYDDFDSKIDGTDLVTGDYSPKHLFNLRSYYDLTDDLELDAGLYVVEGLADGFDDAEYVRADVRLGWRPNDVLELAVGVQDIGSRTRSELDEFDNIPRAAYFSVTFDPQPRSKAVH